MKRDWTSTCKSGIFHRKTSQSHEIITAENGQRLGEYEATAGEVASHITAILFLPGYLLRATVRDGILC